MKKITRLTEKNISNIVKKVINENIQDNNLYQEINDVLSNSNESQEEQIQILKYILKQKEEEAKSRFNPDLTGLENLVKRVIKQRTA